MSMRKITVEGLTYFWRVSRKGSLCLEILDSRDDTKKINVTFRRGPITPKYVRWCILEAMRNGWTSGSTFKWII